MDKTLEQYLVENVNRERPVIDHVLRCSVAVDGTVSFYIHPNGVDGDTRDYVVRGNTLTADPRITRAD